MRPPATRYVPGDWNASCSMCGGTFKASMLQKHWQGMYRCPQCWEPRHPQDFVRAVSSEKPLPWTQAATTHTPIVACTPNGSSAVPGFAVPGCAIPGYLHPFFDAEVEDTPV